MGSELVAAEAVRMTAAAAAVFLGTAAAMLVSGAIHRGDGRGGRRSILAMLCLSGAVAMAAWSFILFLRLGTIPPFMPGYLAAACAAGLLSGFFPRAAGLPLALICLLAAGLVAIRLGPWQAWTDGGEVLGLTAYEAGDGTRLFAYRLPGAGGRVAEGNLRLPEGPLLLEFDRVTPVGPFLLILGPWRYRLSSIHIPGLPETGGPPIPGFTYERIQVPAIEASTLVTYSCVLRPDGSIGLAEQTRYF